MPQIPVPLGELQIQKKPLADTFVCTYVISVLGAFVAEVITYPLDLTKTRLQIQGEIANKIDAKITTAPHRGMLRTGIGIIREEGFFKLWQGIPAQFVRHSIYSGSRMAVYKFLRDKVFTPNPNDNYLPLWKSALCGASAGTFSQIIANPADVVKVQLQMEGKRRLMNLPPRVHGIRHAFVKTVQESGVRGLFKGVVPNAQRAALVNLGDLTTYDTTKQFLLRHTTLHDGTVVHVMGSLCAGFVAAVLGTPADTIKTRIMNQPVDVHGRGVFYKSTFECASLTVRNEGFMALFKGFVPNWLRMAPWSLTFWLFYEQSNKLVNQMQQTYMI